MGNGTLYVQRANALAAGLKNWRTTAAAVGLAVTSVGLFLTDAGKASSIFDLYGIVQAHGTAIVAAFGAVAALFAKDAATGSQP